MLGGVIGGYWASDKLTAATAPARVMTSDSTEAKIGRSMKKCENMGPRSGQRPCPLPVGSLDLREPLLRVGELLQRHAGHLHQRQVQAAHLAVRLAEVIEDAARPD